MDAVWLPVLWQGDTPQNAMVAMEEAKCSGFLVENEDRYEVVSIEAVKEALGRDARTLAQVRQKEPVYLVRLDDAVAAGVDLIRPLRTATQYEALLDKAGYRYALVAHAYEMALVVSGREAYRKQFSQSNTYYCFGGSTTHFFPRPNVRVNDDCPKCLGQPKGKIRQK
jgi:hypothetical protein